MLNLPAQFKAVKNAKAKITVKYVLTHLHFLRMEHAGVPKDTIFNKMDFVRDAELITALNVQKPLQKFVKLARAT